MIESEDLLPGELVIETEFLVEETSCDILIVARNFKASDTKLRVICVRLKSRKRIASHDGIGALPLPSLKLIDENFAFQR